MALTSSDWLVFVVYALATIALGMWGARRAGASSADYFLAGRSMPWWLLGVSMVATTFSTDTPNLVADITRQSGVAGNWVWWAFLLTGMLTTFVYARLWRRCGVTTDLEFYELRYSGKSAAFLRGFRAVYLGVFFNVMVMATVTLAAIKIGNVLFHATPLQTIAVGCLLALVVSTVGGLAGVLWTDLLLFGAAMTGSVIAAVVAVNHPKVGGLHALLAHPNVKDRLDLIPDLSDPAAFVPIFLVPLAVQWWAAWYPGAEPGGGGYVAQRMLAAKNERHAQAAVMFFNAAHYALRPWPWILVALASLVVFPDLAALQSALPHVDPSVLGHDLAYPAMLTFLPAGLLGLVVGSLGAAFISTISTHLNWGASYVVHDVYRRFIRPEASERHFVRAGRVVTVVLMGLAAILALLLQNALQAFQILLQVGAGTGLLFILRWFWWRINAWSEISAMVASFAVALFFFLNKRFAGGTNLEAWQELIVGVAVTTLVWMVVTLLSPRTTPDRLRAFYRLARPGGPGWRHVLQQAKEVGEDLEVESTRWPVPLGVAGMLLGTVTIYSLLFATGLLLFGRWGSGAGLLLLAGCAGFALRHVMASLAR